MYSDALTLEKNGTNNLLYFEILYSFILADFLGHNIYGNLLKHRVLYTASRDIDLVTKQSLSK